MKKLLLLLLVLIPACGLGAQSIVGKWNTIDDNTGKERSVVEIFERDGLIFGKVARIFTQPAKIRTRFATTAPKTTRGIIKRSSAWRSSRI